MISACLELEFLIVHGFPENLNKIILFGCISASMAFAHSNMYVCIPHTYIGSRPV